MSAHLESTTRPNGKVYRPRRPPRVEEYGDGDGSTGVMVLGTHNAFHAGLLAAGSINAYDLDPTNLTVCWLKLVPWDATGGGYDRTWIDDPVTGTPAVMWNIPW